MHYFSILLPQRSAIIAAYDTALRVPKCSVVGASCTSGDDLLKDRGTDRESNAPNSLDTCADGTNGAYMVDESIERVTVRVPSQSGGELRSGQVVEILAKVWAYSKPSEDKADFYYAANAEDPTWIFITTQEPNAPGIVDLPPVQFILPEGGLQAVRVRFRWKGNRGTGSCSGGAYDDVDDLAFVVGPSQMGEEGVPQAGSQKARPSKELPRRRFRCDALDGEGCAEDGRCRWRVDRRAKGGGVCHRKSGGSSRPVRRPFSPFN